MDGHTNDASFEGVSVYINGQQCKHVCSALVWEGSIQKMHNDEEKSSKKKSLEVSKRYLFGPLLYLELGGWARAFASLTLCIGISIKSGTNNNCLLCPDGVFA